MPLLRGDEVIDDGWTRIAGEAPVPAGGAVILSLPRLTAEAEYLWHRPDGIGVELAPGEPIEALEPWTTRLELVALHFPTFTDGRPFSTARLLRERMSFRGELRASGKPIPDQRQFLLQCGFDTIEVSEDDLQRWRRARVWMPLSYQVGYAETRGPVALSVFHARHGQPLALAAA